MKPIIKLAGGKTQLLPEIKKHLPAEFYGYYEPFLGGGALLFDLGRTLGPVVASDSNADLIAMYECVREDPVGVGAVLYKFGHRHDLAHYYSIRELWNAKGTIDVLPAVRAAQFIYLNKACFNGLWRVNRRGEFNVPMGDYAKLSLPSREDLEAASLYLYNVTLRCADFVSVTEQAGKFGMKDVVYFDPPYLPQPGTRSFEAYTRDSFGVDGHKALASTMGTLLSRGCTVILSNSDTPLTRTIYAGFKFHEVSRRGTISSDGEGRQRVGELIITGWDQGTQGVAK